MSLQVTALPRLPAAERPRTYGSIVRAQLARNRGAMAGLTLLAVAIGVALGAPWLAPYDPTFQDLLHPLQPPSRAHPFGTDEVGRDVLSRVIYGSRLSLSVGLISVGIGGTAGVTLGLVSGFYGGWLDDVILRIMDLLLAFPGILLALAIVAVLAWALLAEPLDLPTVLGVLAVFAGAVLVQRPGPTPQPGPTKRKEESPLR